MGNTLKCSIIINTYNRVSFLEKLLASFNHLNYDQFEVIVVNGPSTDATAVLLQKYTGRIKIETCPQAQMTRSRNLGLAAAAGDIVIFIDDDALPAEPTWLDEIIEIFEQDEAGRVGAIGGPVFHQDTGRFQFKGGLISDYCRQIFWEQDRCGITPDGHRWTQRSMGCNSAFRRAALLKIGGFDEKINYYADEGDVCLRLVRQGYQITQPENCAVRHYPAQSHNFGAPFLRNRGLIAQDDTYYCLKNGNDSLLKRLLKTLWLAPRKHFFTEMPHLWRTSQISTGQLLYFLGWQWPKGLATGLWKGLLQTRGTNFSLGHLPEFLPFGKETPSPKLNICLITENIPPYPKIGGVERYTYDLAKALHEFGHTVHLICKSEAPLRRDGLGFNLHGISERNYASTNLFPGKPVLNQRVGYALAAAERLTELTLDGVQLDIVHTTNWNLCGLSLPLMRAFPYLLVLVSPLAEILETQAWEYTDDLRAIVALDRWQIEQASTRLCPSWGVLNVYQEKMGLNIKNLHIQKVQLGIVPNLCVPPPAKKNGLHRLLFVGRLEYRKGAHILLEILPDLLKTHPGWQCDLVGDDYICDTDGKTLKEKFLRHNKGSAWLKRVHFHGAVSDEILQNFYRQCDLFVAPSLFESFGIIYPEAMQYGKPVVGCRTGGIPEIVTNGVDGILVSPGNPTELKDALDRLMNDSQLREKLGKAGLKKVKNVLNYRAMAQRMLVHYQQIIDSYDNNGKRYLPYRLDIFNSTIVQHDSTWQNKETASSQIYLSSDTPGASLCFSIPGHSLLEIVTRRDDSSGILTISVNGRPLQYLDLYSANLLPTISTQVQLPPSQEALTITLTIHPERNPASYGTHVNLERIIVQALP